MRQSSRQWQGAGKAAGKAAGKTAGRGGRHLGVALLALGGAGVQATEGGGNSYPVGVETTYIGIMLPEGAHPLLYVSDYVASHSKNNDGADNAQLAHFRIRSDIVAGRLSLVWPGVHLFGATIETRVVQALAKVELQASVARPAGLAPLDRGGERTGLADTAISPVILGWHGAGYHQTAGIDTHVRLGSYDAAERVNTGRNYNQLAPFYALTWFPTPDADVNAKFRYATNSRNHATGYQSGDEATIEYSAGVKVTPTLQLGLNGYLYRQTSDDVQNGAVVNGNGNRGRVTSAGPYLMYTFYPKWTAIFKVQSEFDARNRPQGTRLWGQIRVPLQW